MKTIAIVILLLAITTVSSHAQMSTNVLGECMAKETTGAEREHFAKWIFSIMANHPVAEQYSRINENERERIDRETATLVTRLIVTDCAEEARTAYGTGGERALMNAFRTMGEIAVQELFRDENVNRRSESWLKYLDEDTFDSLLE